MSELVRQVDALGRVAIPIEIRKEMGIPHGAWVVFKTVPSGAYIKLIPITVRGENK